MVVSALLGLASAAHAQVTNYTTTLSGANESPPTTSLGIGNGSVRIDEDTDEMRVHMDFSGLTSGTTASHIHCCTSAPQTGNAGVATMVPTFVNFPLGVTAGTYDMSFNLLDESTYNPAFLSANGGTADTAETALLDGLAAGTAYLNIHTTEHPTGEIRGFLVAAPIPEPGHFAMLLLGLAAVGGMRRWRAGAAR
jgi:hypothetical protein